eukprot:CAMPEP_0168626706 /NCGR_PEP_ID=MMETSP0449_2-20121227/10791_1 /TAXON_ID=1082188 /ORGANISM="Strombidium rassoulzadegani, Strain ras09" /LENGTH=68 /DNA_ID=CAMNT_0008668751 /DNA_START=54 /DNA_END=260 /DNA_ORIENTATION=+
MSSAEQRTKKFDYIPLKTTEKKPSHADRRNSGMLVHFGNEGKIDDDSEVKLRECQQPSNSPQDSKLSP